MKFKMIWIVLTILFFCGPLWVLHTGQVDFKSHWSKADRSSAGLAPRPSEYKPAVFQVYAARAYNWRGLFAVHTWFAVKAKNANTYIVYQIVGWRTFWNLPVLFREDDIPDRIWFGNKPWLLKDLRGPEAEGLVEKIKTIADKYPYQNVYHYWPGPNSNTFPAFLLRDMPELKLALPSIAIGKDYLGMFKFFAKAPSNTGYQFSILGIFGILVAVEEGLEINVLGGVFGINFKYPGITLPGIGRIDISRK
jgi:hypothetical protein